MTEIAPGAPEIPWEVVPQTASEQERFDSIEPVHAVATVVRDDGKEVRHTISKVGDHYQVGELFVDPPLCGATVEEAMAALEAYYAPDYTDAWREHMRRVPPPGWAD